MVILLLQKLDPASCSAAVQLVFQLPYRVAQPWTTAEQPWTAAEQPYTAAEQPCTATEQPCTAAEQLAGRQLNNLLGLIFGEVKLLFFYFQKTSSNKRHSLNFV